MKSPVVSIVIACYKSNHIHLLEALDSALGQSFSDIEILVADDSPDDMLKQVVSTRQDSRVKYYHNSPSFGPAENHWNAFELAKGEYVAILNHDDRLEKTFVQTLKKQLDDNPSCGLAFCDHWIMDSSGRIQYHETDENSNRYGRFKLRPGVHRPFSQLVISQTIPMAMGALFRRSSLPYSFPKNVGPAYDLWLTYLLARTGSAASYVPERLSFWRDHIENTTSGGGVAWLEDSANCWLTLYSDPFFSDFRQITLDKSSKSFVSCSMSCWKRSAPLSAFKFALKSLSMKYNMKALFILLFVLWCPYGLLTLVKGRDT